MSSIFIEDYPPIIILEPPGTALPGAHRYRCMACTESFRISDKAYQLVRDLRRDKRIYVVVCYGCHKVLVPKLTSNGNLATNADVGRSLLGYR